MNGAVYSNLPQVVPDTDTFKEHSADTDTHKIYQGDQDTYKISSNHTNTHKIWYDTAEEGTVYADKEIVNTDELPIDKKERRICGLTRKIFLILTAIIVVLVVVAAVGGGVGGSLSSKKNRAQAVDISSTSATTSQVSTLNSSASKTSPTATSTVNTVSVTTTQVILPSQTLLRDCPSSNNTDYVPTASTVETPMTFLKVCLRTWVNAINGFNAVNTPTASLNDCIDLCAAYNIANQTQISNSTGNVCNSVCWRWGAPGDTYWPGQCFGFMTSNVTGTFVEEENGWCDGARWIDQSFGRT